MDLGEGETEMSNSQPELCSWILFCHLGTCFYLFIYQIIYLFIYLALLYLSANAFSTGQTGKQTGKQQGQAAQPVASEEVLRKRP